MSCLLNTDRIGFMWHYRIQVEWLSWCFDNIHRRVTLSWTHTFFALCAHLTPKNAGGIYDARTAFLELARFWHILYVVVLYLQSEQYRIQEVQHGLQVICHAIRLEASNCNSPMHCLMSLYSASIGCTEFTSSI